MEAVAVGPVAAAVAAAVVVGVVAVVVAGVVVVAVTVVVVVELEAAVDGSVPGVPLNLERGWPFPKAPETPEYNNNNVFFGRVRLTNYVTHSCT